MLLSAAVCAVAYTLPVFAADVSQITNFNNTADLSTYFNDDGTPVFTNQSNGGINDTGSVNVPIGSNEIWTTKQGYSVSGAGDVYIFSAYFKVAVNSGWGNLGFTAADTNTISTGDGQPAIGLGANFHGGGGAFYNNGSATVLSWPPDLVLGNWYWMTFEVSAKGSNTFDLKLQIWNTDSSGVIGTMKTEKTLSNVVNASLGSATTIHAFFGAAGSRMSRIDDFGIDLSGATIIEEGEPVILSGTLGTPTDTTISFGGNATDDQGSAITAKGVCWSTSTSPTTSDSCTNDGSGTGSFSSSVSGLTAGTTYYIRAYATNAIGTSYGAESSFTTSGSTPSPSPAPSPSPSPSPTTDSDGVDNAIEAAAPNNGDANNDGTPDNQQEKVASTLSPVSNAYVSVETASCNSINSLIVNKEPTTPSETDKTYDYPVGLADFTLTGCGVGATETITQYYFGNYEVNKVVARKYNENSHTFTTISGATVAQVTIGGQKAIKLQYVVQDGGSLDADGIANGVIVDPVGLGVLSGSLESTGSPIQHTMIFGSLLILFALISSPLKIKKTDVQ